MTTTQITYIRFLASYGWGWEDIWKRIKNGSEFQCITAEQVRRIVLDRGK